MISAYRHGAEIAPPLRHVVRGHINAFPGMGPVFRFKGGAVSIGPVFAPKVAAQPLPAGPPPPGSSASSLFQVMTLGRWSKCIVHPVMETFRCAPAFFVQVVPVTPLSA